MLYDCTLMDKKKQTKQTNAKTINCKQEASNKISAQIRRSNHKQGIRKSRISIPAWQKKLRSNCQPKKLPAKPVRLFYKVTSHRTDKEMTEEKKYESRDDDGNINFTREHQLYDTDGINRVNTNDSDGTLILQNQDDINRTNANDRNEGSTLQNQDGINRINANDRDERSILQDQDGGQYQGQHTASSWANI